MCRISSVSDMKSAIMQQPVSIAMEANQASFQSYMCSITRLLSFIISCFFLSRLVFNHSFAFSFSFCNMALRVATVAVVVGVAAIPAIPPLMVT